MIDGKLLEQAFKTVAIEKFREEIRSFIIYNAPPDIVHLLHEYERLVEQSQGKDITIDE